MYTVIKYTLGALKHKEQLKEIKHAVLVTAASFEPCNFVLAKAGTVELGVLGLL